MSQRRSVTADRPVRILLLKSNRYGLLLARRAIAGRFQTAVVSCFTSAEPALEEIRRTAYDFVLIGAEILVSEKSRIVEDIRRAASAGILVVSGVSDLPREVKSAIEKHADFFTSEIGEDTAGLPELIGLIASQLQSIVGMPEDSGPAKWNITANGELIVGALSHRINNPLMTILGTTELLLDEPDRLSGDQAEKIRMIRDSAHRIQHSMKQLAKNPNPRQQLDPAII